MFLNLEQRTQAQVWLDVQFSDFRMLAGIHVYLFIPSMSLRNQVLHSSWVIAILAGPILPH